jgi:hypothetical protein
MKAKDIEEKLGAVIVKALILEKSCQDDWLDVV